MNMMERGKEGLEVKLYFGGNKNSTSGVGVHRMGRVGGGELL